MLLLYCCMLLGAFTTEAAPQEDQISNLPGLDKQPSFRHYSGFLNATGGKYLHYWFVEAQQNPSTSPVVLWLNGGPGCSSLAGFLAGHGPFLVQEDGRTLKYNQYSWNKIANMLYLESPAGVGFSYSNDKQYMIDDSQTAQDNYMALKDFFRLFPEFTANEFYITGESYGGFYVPTLAVELSKDESIKLKGIAIGNGLTNYIMNYNSLIFFSYYHGLLDTKTWSFLESACCGNKKNEQCELVNSEKQECSKAVGSALYYSQTGLNIYNLYKPCDGGKPGEIRDLGDHIVFYHPGIHSKKLHPDILAKLESLSHLNKPVRMAVPCIDDTSLTTYLNSPAVQEALHIKDREAEWSVCSEEVFQLYIRELVDVRDKYLEVLKKGHRIFVYSGDVDMACNFLGIEWFVHSLEQKLEVPYTAWWNREGKEPQIAGFVKQYTNLTILTVKGAGHMVAEDKPEEALILFRHFINNEQF